MTLQELKHKEQILTQAYGEFEKPLRGYAFSKLRDKALSEDITQEAFLKVWAFLRKGGEVMNMKSFLYRVVNNLIVDEYRKHKATSLDALLEKDFEPGFDNSQIMIDYLDGKSLVSLISELPEKCRAVMDMRYGKNLTIEEIAKKVFTSKNNVSVQLHRGHKGLKKLCEQMEEKSKLVTFSFPFFFDRRLTPRVA